MTQTIATQRGKEQPADKSAIRPFQKVNFPEAELTELRRRVKRDQVTGTGNGRGSIARRATRDDSKTRALLGDRLRLAQGRGETELPTEFHYRNRWARHSFHSRSFET